MDLLDRIRMHEDYLEVFDNPTGQKVLRHICKVGHVFEPCFVKGDSHESALREGERRLALSILRYVYKDHAAFINMIEKGVEEEA